MEAIQLDTSLREWPAASRPAAAIQSRPAKAPASGADTASSPGRGGLDQAARELASHFKVNVEMARDSSGRNVVRIMSPDGRRLLRQMPPEEVIRLADQARRGSIKGLLTLMV